MNAKRISALVAAALVMGLVAGNVASSFAATTSTTTGSGAALRLGATMRDSGGRLLDVVAKLTGTSTAAVVAERQAGKTYTQIAAAKGISSATVVDEALKVRTTTLTAKVKDGSITQAQADAAAANMKTRLTTRVDSVNTACDGNGAGSAGSGGGKGGGRGAGRGGAWAAAEPAPSPSNYRRRAGCTRAPPRRCTRCDPTVGYSHGRVVPVGTR